MDEYRRILNEQEWAALEAAEQGYYDGHGTHAYTDVTPREESTSIAAMWDWAQLGVESMMDPDVDDFDEAAITKATAERVAHAIATLAFGADFANEGRERGEQNPCEGHPAGEFDPLGETTYCDGSCQS